MQKIWQSNWFEIDFKEVTKISDNKIAGDEFYNKYYNIFYSKYSSYDELPPSWKDSKNIIAQDIHKKSKTHDKVLSIGSGIGYVEQQLVSLRGGGDRNRTKWYA